MSMQQEVYEAFRDLGVNEEKALKAATAISRREDAALEPMRRDIGDLKRDVIELKRDVTLLKWGQGLNTALLLAVLVKLFVH